jgi:hypothetical protein
MAIDVHQCPRCELRFRNSAELRDHFGHDHRADPDTFERYRYRGRSDLPPPARGPRYLVVGNQTLHDDHLDEALAERAGAQGASFFVLVPATHSAHHETPPAGADAPGDPHVGDDVGLALARWRLRTMIDRLHDRGYAAEGQVGHPDPFTAVSRVMADGGDGFDEIVLSTLPVSLSRWLDVDLPTRLERRFRVPVTTVAADRVAPS